MTVLCNRFSNRITNMATAIAKNGKKGDFLGHEGGDDFLLLTALERAQKIADYIIEEFDRRIKGLYTEDELKKGYIEGMTRDSDDVKRVPIMTISMVGAGNYYRNVESYGQLTGITAELKKAAKKVQKSNFLIDRRTQDLGKGEKFRYEDGS